MAFNTTSTTAIGTKGSDVFTATGVEDPRVALSVLLTRGACLSDIHSGIETILAMEDKEQAIKDIFVMAFQTRDIRGGKGERAVAYEMFNTLLADKTVGSLASDVLDLVPEYGCWRDLFMMAQMYPGLQGRVLDITEQQFDKDQVTMAGGSVSLMAKHAPREDKYPELYKSLANRLFASEPKFSRRLKALRQALSAMNKVAHTVEIQMCSNHFADIKPGEVPGRALQKYTKAFLNQPSTYSHPLYHRPLADQDRVECAEHFSEHFAKAAKGEAKLNGSKTVFPHELIKKVVISSHCSPSYYREYGAGAAMTQEEKDATVGVWNQMVKDAKDGGGLGRSLAMCDFSGSMRCSGSNKDTPYWVSMALGLLISEVTTDEFKDIFLTFDSDPKFHHLPKGDIFERVASLHAGLSQGTSTDFQKAMDLVLQRCKAMRVRPGQEPENLIVLTDMNWDEACGSHETSGYTGNRYRHVVKTESWQTHVEMIRESFKRAGEDMWGEGQGLKMPRIVIWNIAATSTDFHAQADTEGVVMLSGWSPSLFKVLQKEGVVIQTPYSALRCQLDDERYDPVRLRVEAWLAARSM